MDVSLLKYNIIEQLMDVDDEKLLREISELIKPSPVSDAEPELKPITVEELNERIRKAEDDIEANRVYSTEEVKKKLGIA